MENFEKIVAALNAIIWSDVLVYLLLAVGIYFSCMRACINDFRNHLVACREYIIDGYFKIGKCRAKGTDSFLKSFNTKIFSMFCLWMIKIRYSL